MQIGKYLSTSTRLWLRFSYRKNSCFYLTDLLFGTLTRKLTAIKLFHLCNDALCID